MKSILLLLAPLAICFAQTGAPVPEFARIDANLEQLRLKYQLPGVAAAVAYQGRLVYARGFGFADPATQRPVTPETLFRIASVSKPFTAVTLLKLQEAGKLRLDDRVFDILTEVRPLLGDPRMLTITIRQLLQHTAGWDSANSGDPMFPGHDTLVELGAGFPPSLSETTAFWLSLPLDFTPGARYAYSNFGYALAGLVIERVTGLPYDSAVRSMILEPLGISRMRPARTLAAAPNEAAYFSLSNGGDDRALSVFSAEPRPVPAAYGSYAIENMIAHGGWLATASDVLRLLTSLESFLSPESWRQLIAPPSGLPSAASWYGLGFDVIPSGSGYALTHNGALSGTSYAIFARGADGNAFSFLTNAMTGDSEGGGNLDTFEYDVLTAIASVTSTINRFPAGNLFEPAYSTSIPKTAPEAVANAITGQRGPLVPGGYLAIYGVDLNATTVWFDEIPVAPLYASPSQVNVAVPAGITGRGSVALALERGGVLSPPILLPILAVGTPE